VVLDRRQWRTKSTKRIIDEIKTLVSKYNLNGIFLLDDNFFVNLERAKEILKGIKGIEIFNLNGRADAVSRFDDEMIQLMRDANVKSMYLGVESGSEKILKKISKEITVEQIIASNKNLKKAGIIPSFSFMTGFPFESKEDLDMTLKLICLLKEQNRNVVAGLNIFNPYPSEIFEECEGFDPKTTEDWAFEFSKIDLPWISRKQMKKIEKINISVALLMPFDYKLSLREISKAILSTISQFRIKNDFYHLFFEDKTLELYKKLIKPIGMDDKKMSNPEDYEEPLKPSPTQSVN
jgi:radical SAM superfamily enzyme YgiQ (UPF0313 family)